MSDLSFRHILGRMRPLDNPILVLVALWLSATTLAAQGSQPDLDMRDLYRYGDDHFVEVYTEPGPSSNRSRATVLVRLSYQLLTFKKGVEPSTRRDVYTATPSVYVEAEAMDGVIVDYGSWDDTVKTYFYAATNSKEQFVPTAIELELQPGRYIIQYSVDDGTPGGQFTREIDTLNVPDYSGGQIAIGRPLFLDSVSATALIPAAIDGNVHFGRHIRMWLPIATPEQPTELTYELYRDSTRSGKSDVVASGSARDFKAARLSAFQPSGSGYRVVTEEQAPTGHAWGSYVVIPAANLMPGPLRLDVTLYAGSGEATTSFRFRSRWIDMPYTFSDTSYAIQALWPIAEEETIDDLRSLPEERRRDGLWEFWKSYDPTPETAYNEKLAQYYERVDYAFVNFSSLNEPDGARSDRGKIYVLYGPPDSKTRETGEDDKEREVWTYSNGPERAFVFADLRGSGHVRLVEYYDL